MLLIFGITLVVVFKIWLDGNNLRKDAKFAKEMSRKNKISKKYIKKSKYGDGIIWSKRKDKDGNICTHMEYSPYDYMTHLKLDVATAEWNIGEECNPLHQRHNNFEDFYYNEYLKRDEMEEYYKNKSQHGDGIIWIDIKDGEGDSDYRIEYWKYDDKTKYKINRAINKWNNLSEEEQDYYEDFKDYYYRGYIGLELPPTNILNDSLKKEQKELIGILRNNPNPHEPNFKRIKEDKTENKNSEKVLEDDGYFNMLVDMYSK